MDAKDTNEGEVGAGFSESAPGTAPRTGALVGPAPLSSVGKGASPRTPAFPQPTQHGEWLTTTDELDSINSRNIQMQLKPANIIIKCK